LFAPDPPAVERGGQGSGYVGPASAFLSRLERPTPTPLLSLTRLAAEDGGHFELWAKAEYLNPSGSVKDRAARAIVERAFDRGLLGGGQILVDASSGNTALAYARLGAQLGFSVELFVPRNANPVRLARLRELGAVLHGTDPAEGTDGAQREARHRAGEATSRYFYADQYNNPANPDAHYRTTGPEIWSQTSGRVTTFVAGVGTGGTISGVGRFLKERDPGIEIVAVEPSGPIHGLEGLKHLPTATRPSTYDASVVDRTERVETEEAQEMVRRIARGGGPSVGPSAGAAVYAALRLGRIRPGRVLVTILPDAGPGAGEV
jgi:S-sulfo-L-cysteine synthase (O-acetyl-L-serine-dependent)